MKERLVEERPGFGFLDIQRNLDSVGKLVV